MSGEYEACRKVFVQDASKTIQYMCRNLHSANELAHKLNSYDKMREALEWAFQKTNSCGCLSWTRADRKMALIATQALADSKEGK